MSAEFPSCEMPPTTSGPPSRTVRATIERTLLILISILSPFHLCCGDRQNMHSSLGRSPTAFGLDRKHCHLSAAEVVPRFAHGSQQCGPILEIGCEDLLHHSSCQLWRQNIEHHRRISHLVRQSRPIEII